MSEMFDTRDTKGIVTEWGDIIGETLDIWGRVKETFDPNDAPVQVKIPEPVAAKPIVKSAAGVSPVTLASPIVIVAVVVAYFLFVKS